ncbi:hypothetical protein FRC07_012016, partial [Ceratobasidium sp. 392]
MKVKLHDYDSIKRFSTTRVKGRLNFGPLLHSLLITPSAYSPELLDESVDLVRHVLSLALNLKRLSLPMDYTAHTIIRNIQYPFSLVHLKCLIVIDDFATGVKFLQFLIDQPMLEDLFICCAGPLLPAFRAEVYAKHELLPRLRSVSSSYNVLTALIPGRPVNQVNMQPQALHSFNSDEFATAVSQSLVPIDFVTVTFVCDPLKDIFSNPEPVGLLLALGQHSVQPKCLTIIMMEKDYIRTGFGWAASSNHEQFS